MDTTIPLSKGYAATVSPEDYERLAAHRWYVTEKKGGTHPYAARWGKDGKRVYMHREIAGVPGLPVDHINGDTLDNRRENLRAATVSQNAANQHTPVRALSGRRGVALARHRFEARIRFNGKRMSLGCYGTADEAADAIARFREANA